MEQVVCWLCGQPFYPTTRQGLRGGKLATRCYRIDCRRAYYRQAAKKHRDGIRGSAPDKKCLECANIITTHDARKYCSDHCCREALLRRRRVRECPPREFACARCGEFVIAKAEHRYRYCSAKCRNEAHREKERFRLKGLDLSVSVAIRCMICGAKGNLVIDHDHDCCPGQKACGKCFRGMLCHAHNVALGLFQDNPALLRKAAGYIERAKRDQKTGQLRLIV
jgi:Recombination endonuclease VII